MRSCAGGWAAHARCRRCASTRRSSPRRSPRDSPSRPHLLVRNVRVYGIRQVGADSDHLRCKITVGRFTFDAMAFRRGDHVEAMTDAGFVDAVVTVGTGLRGFVELELRDFGPVGTADRMRGEAVPA